MHTNIRAFCSATSQKSNVRVQDVGLPTLILCVIGLFVALTVCALPSFGFADAGKNGEGLDSDKGSVIQTSDASGAVTEVSNADEDAGLSSLVEGDTGVSSAVSDEYPALVTVYVNEYETFPEYDRYTPFAVTDSGLSVCDVEEGLAVICAGSEEENLKLAKQRILAAIAPEALQSKVTFSYDEQITVGQAKSVLQAYFDNPKYFWLNHGYSYSYYKTAEDANDCVIAYLNLSYSFTSETIGEAYDAFQQGVESALSWVSDDMTTEQRIQALHDYLVQNVSYDTEAAEQGFSAKPHAYSAYGALALGSAVCQGYGYAYKYLMILCDIPCQYVISTNHLWNVVYLDNAWYYMDVTWDDPIGGTRVYYNYYLLGTNSFTDHDTFTNPVVVSASNYHPSSHSFVTYTAPASHQTPSTALAGNLNNGKALTEVRCQMQQGFSLTDSSAKARFTVGIDDLNYEKAGLLISPSASSDSALRQGEPGVKAIVSQAVYERVWVSGVLRAPAWIFDSGYHYVVSVCLNNIPQSYYNTTYYVRGFVEKTDGTMVYGPVRSFSVNS